VQTLSIGLIVRTSKLINDTDDRNLPVGQRFLVVSAYNLAHRQRRLKHDVAYLASISAATVSSARRRICKVREVANTKKAFIHTFVRFFYPYRRGEPSVAWYRFDITRTIVLLVFDAPARPIHDVIIHAVLHVGPVRFPARRRKNSEASTASPAVSHICAKIWSSERRRFSVSVRGRRMLTGSLSAASWISRPTWAYLAGCVCLSAQPASVGLATSPHALFI